MKLVNPSVEELFILWAEDLISLGYIKRLKPNSDMRPIVLQDDVKTSHVQEILLYKGTKKEKVKRTLRTSTLHKAVQYTPDFMIIWNPKAIGIFTTDIEDVLSGKTGLHDTYFTHHNWGDDKLITAIDVKAPAGYGGRNNSDVSFSVKSKWVWASHGLRIQKVMLFPIKKVKVQTPYLWLCTFTASRYFMTDGLTKNRTISKWDPITVREFIEKTSP